MLNRSIWNKARVALAVQTIILSCIAQVLPVADKRKPIGVLTDDFLSLCGATHARSWKGERKSRSLCWWNPSKSPGLPGWKDISHFWRDLCLVRSMQFSGPWQWHGWVLHSHSFHVGYLKWYFILRLGRPKPVSGIKQQHPCQFTSHDDHVLSWWWWSMTTKEKMVYTSVWGVGLFGWRPQHFEMNLACPWQR